jgi:short-subunit dehydrogenase
MMLKPRPGVGGKVVIVTGASSGIGEAAARAFAMAGARVVVVARRAQKLEALVDEITAAGGEALAVPADLTDRHQIERVVARTLERYGRIDVLANVAGWGKYDWIEEFTAEELRQQFEVNVLAMAEITRQVVPIMQRQRSGHLLNMSSYASRIAVPPLTVYASTKYAVEGLSDGLRRELAPWGIHVSRVHPAAVPGTEFNQQAAQRGGIRYRSVPIGRVSKEKVAETLLRLVERPRRAAFLGRLYDVGVWANRRWPGLLDLGSRLWVMNKRREALARPVTHARPKRRGRLAALPALTALIPFGVVLGVAGLWWNKDRRSE